MKPMIAAALAFAVLAPAAASAQPQRDPQAYKALGTEPFWSLSIDARTIRFESANGGTVNQPTPKVIHGFAGEIYQTRRIGVNIVHKPCNDGMSDRTFPDSVQVTVDGKRYEGCGGAPANAPGPQAGPVGGDWRVVTLSGRPPLRGTNVTISFRGQRVSGNTGCNSFNGSYRYNRGALTAGPFAVTKRACLGRGANQQEQTLLRLLAQPLRATPQPNGRLILRAPRGETLVLAKSVR